MKTKVSAADAKAHFAECLRAVEQGRPVVITRHGKPVAALVPAEEAAQLRRLQAAGPHGGLAGIAGGWKDSDELVQQVAHIRRTRPRKAAQLASR
jgi:prevent-host-death family protein